MTLDKSRQEQYSRKVEENFPDRLAMIDYERFYKVLEEEFRSMGLDDEGIAHILKKAERESLALKFEKSLSLRYGENPGQPAAFYRKIGARGNMADMKVLLGGSKGLGYINLGDMDLGQRIVRKLNGIFPEKKICALIKHEMPSAVAIGDSSLVFEKAWDSDPLSNFGSVDVFNYKIDESDARPLAESRRNIEVIYAPGFTDKALEILSSRKPLRAVKMKEMKEEAFDYNDEYKRVAGGLLVQRRYDSKIISHNSVEVISQRKPSPDEMDAAIFNWIVCGFTRSNAVVIGMRDKTHGIGSGQRSRIDSAENAIRLSKRGYGPQGCVLASDAYMPFPDVVDLAADNGITSIIYPLGSKKDEEVLKRADERGLSMIVTRRKGDADSERCFLHR